SGLWAVERSGFIYTQFGINNFNYLSARKAGFFVHDALGEYAFVKTKLSLGMGLSAWSGLARFASPSVGTIMGVDAPLFEQSTNDVTDQFLRKLSVYAKGKLGKFDYRLVMSSSLAIQQSTPPGTPTGIGRISNFSLKPPRMQGSGYVQWQFLDQETNLTPYFTGTYLGTKKVFNVGAGFVYQPGAMWHLAENGRDTVSTTMRQLAVDVYYDAPVGNNGQALSVYTAFVDFNFGPNYTRNNGVMNPANGNRFSNVLNGAGNAFPLVGTGNVLYAQAGYKLKNGLLGTYGTFMPYASVQHSTFGRLADPVNFYDVGINWLLAGHTSKLTMAYQSRPIYTTDAGGIAHATTRKGSAILQYQVFFN
ncbi:MAG: hypothetical protein LH606_07105, partial [Cytophagaceae bacterium]|nr:hypothetical protein [Cytophagaceae bacterium]